MNLFLFLSSSFVCRNLLIGSFSSLADEELNVNKIIYTQTLEFGLCLQITSALLERLRGLTPCLKMPQFEDLML